ncbi:hypothetical protein SALWKB2_1126 [Snodgrassella alvi wkB2]|nr:hypothetical protein SALWKB2_1126 [Snodgrassella alvi wkB2]
MRHNANIIPAHKAQPNKKTSQRVKNAKTNKIKKAYIHGKIAGDGSR